MRALTTCLCALSHFCRVAGSAVRVVATRNNSFAHEAPVWFPETRQLFFVSNRLVDSITGISVLHSWLSHPHASFVPRRACRTKEGVFRARNTLHVWPSAGLPYIELSLLSLDSGNVTTLVPSPPILMANGGTPYGPGKVLVCSQVRHVLACLAMPDLNRYSWKPSGYLLALC